MGWPITTGWMGTCMAVDEEEGVERSGREERDERAGRRRGEGREGGGLK